MVGALQAQEPDVQFASGLSDSLEAQLRSVAARVPEFGGRLYANLGRAPGSKDEEERYAVIWNPPAQRQ